MNYSNFIKSPLGFIQVTSNEKNILSVLFTTAPLKTAKHPACLVRCLKQLREYFAGKRKKFNLPVALSGTKFQQKVWNALQTIPYDKTWSYQELAKAIGKSKAARAVGNANNKNQIPLIIPCHRVIASSGKLSGYGSGIWRKKWLLEHEKKA